MRRRPLQQTHGNHPNVTPLIDIVMCLIIFFMLVAKIGISTGADASIMIPESIRGSDMKDPAQALVLNVRAGVEDQPMITALIEGTTNQPEEIKLTDPSSGRQPLLEYLKYRRGGDPKKGIPPNPDFKVIIRADQEMSYNFLEPVLRTCMEAKVKNVNFNTRIVRE